MRCLHFPIALTAIALCLAPDFARPAAETNIQSNPFGLMMIQKNPSMLRISGDVSSTAHSLILQQTARRYYASHDLGFDFDDQVRVPPGWSLITEMVLRAVAHTDAARAHITASSVKIEGISTRLAEYELAKIRVESALLPGMVLYSSVSEMPSAHSFMRLCQQRFRTTANAGRIEFAISTTEFESDAWPLLDALVEIAMDCPLSKIRITGHTDSSGNAATNRQLGRARATKVIDHMAGRGIPTGRFEVSIAADNKMTATTPLSRRLSRRVDIELLVP